VFVIGQLAFDMGSRWPRQLSALGFLYSWQDRAAVSRRQSGALTLGDLSLQVSKPGDESLGLCFEHLDVVNDLVAVV
jgi:hypothetical protein